MYSNSLNVAKLNDKDLEDVRCLFIISALSNLARQNLNIPGIISAPFNNGKMEMDIVKETLDTLIDISLNVVNSITPEEREYCNINRINDYIQNNCQYLCPELLALYLTLKNFTEAKVKVFNDMLLGICDLKPGHCSRYVYDNLDKDKVDLLDQSMWSLAGEIENLIKGN